MDTIYIYRGDTKTIQFNLTTSGTGSAFDATGYTPWLTVKEGLTSTGSPYLIDVSGTVANGSVINVDLTSGNTNLVGIKAAELEITSGTNITTAKQFWIEFKQDVRV